MAYQFPIYFGKGKQYSLTERSLQHIIDGEFAIRPSRDSAGKKVSEQVLAGGLHTYTSWEAFLALHPGVVHLQEYDTTAHKDWYFARELQNGVIALKIPRCLFTGNAASITMQPDTHYKSGYLWKTLYPTTYSIDDILSAIAQALENIDREDSSFLSHANANGLIFGYARVDQPFEAIRLRLQLHGNEIRSAFPSWNQPMTGNNGKAYSHEHSIAFQIASSTVGHEKFSPPDSAVFSGGKFNLDALVSITPDFLLTRDKPTYGVIQDEWHAARMDELRKVADSCSEGDIEKVIKYLNDYATSKEPCYVQARIYKYYLNELDNSLPLFNAAQLVENICESCWVLSLYDRKQGSMEAIHSIVRFLKMAVVHTGGLDSLQYKRLLGVFLEIAAEHHDIDSVKDVIDALAKSPCRAALYTEFNLNPYVKVNDEDCLCIIGTSGVRIALSSEHLFDFISLNLGENYLFIFDKAKRLAIARGLWQGRNSERLIADSLAFGIGADYDFFIPAKYDPSDMVSGKTSPSETALICIAKDYGRMLIIYRQRVVAEDVNAYVEELDFDDWGSQRFFEITRQKHKRTFIQIMHEQMLQSFIRFGEKQKYEKLRITCQRALRKLPKEHVPFPKGIPNYIQSWQTSCERNDSGLDKLEILEKILGV